VHRSDDVTRTLGDRAPTASDDAAGPTLPSSRPSAVTPDKIDRYMLIRPLGAGGMGKVYAAYDPDLDRKVAIKLLHADGAGSADHRARMLREAQAMARVASPNVVQVFDVGAFDDQIYITMELVAGGTLRGWLAEAPRTWRDIVRVFVAAGRGLAAAHAKELIHRDFKPDNVLVDGDRVCVGDFGLATARGAPVRASLAELAVEPAELDRRVTEAGSILGTPAYMAPEQLAGEEADARSDQFAFCVALYEALYRVRPYEAPSIPALIAVMSERAVRPPAGLPSWLRAVLARGLATDRARRYPAMADLLADLERGLARRRRMWTAAAIGGLVAAALTVALSTRLMARSIGPPEGAIVSSCSANVIDPAPTLVLPSGWCFYAVVADTSWPVARMTFQARLRDGRGYGVWVGAWNRGSVAAPAVQYERGFDKLYFPVYPDTEHAPLPDLPMRLDSDWHAWEVVADPIFVTMAMDGRIVYRQPVAGAHRDFGFRTWIGSVAIRELQVR
jgi:hypothetical protein